MNEMNIPQPPENRKNPVATTFILATMIVTLACIAACAAVTMTFLMNPPW